MAGFFSRLFGRRDQAAEPERGPAVEYKGFRIRPAPFKSEGQFQTAGTIEKDFADGTREHRFIRAEKHANIEEASSFAVTKGKQIVDERGDRVFETR